MATSAANPLLRSRTVASPASPHTPLLGRSISSQFGSPSAFRTEQDEQIVYELGATHFSAGFAGESRPRCILHFDRESGRRVGDYRAYDASYRPRSRKKVKRDEDWGKEHELYRIDLRSVDLGLFEDKFERALRTVHVDYLQLDQKPRKAVLAVPSLLPTPLLEIVLKVLFNITSQTPSITILTTPLLACVGAGLRNALVVDIGWGETVITAIGEYREIAHRRSVRAGKLLTREMGRLLEEEVKTLRQVEGGDDGIESEVTFEYAEEVTTRMGWCRPLTPSHDLDLDQSTTVKIPAPPSSTTSTPTNLHIPFTRLSKPAETLFSATTPSTSQTPDDHDLPLHTLAYNTLLPLPLDLRALLLPRIILTGGLSSLPGLQPRFLQELAHLIETRGWDPVHNYGSATAWHDKALKERSVNITSYKIAKQQQQAQKIKSAVNGDAEDRLPLSTLAPQQEGVPHAERVHDDVYDQVTRKVESKLKIKADGNGLEGGVRGVRTLGAWAGASLVASLRVKGVREVEREEFGKHGLRDEGAVV